MKHDHRENLEQHSPMTGGIWGVLAFLIWGLSPLYWKQLRNVPAFEILMHRMVWSFVFLVPVLLLQRRWNQFLFALKERRTLIPLTCSTLLVGCNWFIYIWAINHDHVLQTSLGYFITPLVNVLLGMIFLNERLRPAQWVSVALVAGSVSFLTIRGGQFPWIALALAVSFGFYGLIRKITPVSALAGLCVETFLMTIPALCYLCYLDMTSTGAIFRLSVSTDLLLMGTALVTAFPLLMFTLSARRIRLCTLGFLQYIAPSCTFVLGAFYFHEPISGEQIWSFGLIWTGLLIYSVHSAIACKDLKQ